MSIINLFVIFCATLPMSCVQEGGNVATNIQVIDSSKKEIVAEEKTDTITIEDSILKKTQSKNETRRKPTEIVKAVNKPTLNQVKCFDYELNNYDTNSYVLVRVSSKQWCLNDRLVFYKEPKNYDKTKYAIKHIGNKWYLAPKTDGKIHSHKTESLNGTNRIITQEDLQKKASIKRKE